MKMKEKRQLIENNIGNLASKGQLDECKSIQNEDTKNLNDFVAYSVEDEISLLTMLNTLKLKEQFYRTEGDQLSSLRDLVYKVGMKDPYLLAQMIVYSRCMGEGMRAVNHVAAALAAPFISGKPYAKAFYGLFDKTKKQGGCIFRTDDMTEIKDAYNAMTSKSLSNAMKKGFAEALVNLDAYQLTKYKKTVIDIANLVHPDIKMSKAVAMIDGEQCNVIDAILNGKQISANTWEANQSEAGQVVSRALKSGAISEYEAEKLLVEAKSENWKSLIENNELGIIAALRNVNNILNVVDDDSTIDKLCGLLTDVNAIKKNLVLPIYFDLAYTVLTENRTENASKVKEAITKGYELSIPNLKEILKGNTCVIIDNSGSMHDYVHMQNITVSFNSTNSCAYKAGLIAATIAKATDATVIRFGSSASIVQYDKNDNLFDLAKHFGKYNMGCTDLSSAFELITRNNMKFDRIIILSDNEINAGDFGSKYYKNYVLKVCSPYVYTVDLAAYGTTPVKGNKVKILAGYGPALYESIKENEFDAISALDKVRKVVIDPAYVPETSM